MQGVREGSFDIAARAKRVGNANSIAATTAGAAAICINDRRDIGSELGAVIHFSRVQMLRSHLASFEACVNMRGCEFRERQFTYARDRLTFDRCELGTSTLNVP